MVFQQKNEQSDVQFKQCDTSYLNFLEMCSNLSENTNDIIAQSVSLILNAHIPSFSCIEESFPSTNIDLPPATIPATSTSFSDPACLTSTVEHVGSHKMNQSLLTNLCLNPSTSDFNLQFIFQPPASTHSVPPIATSSQDFSLPNSGQDPWIELHSGELYFETGPSTEIETTYSLGTSFSIPPFYPGLS